VGFVLIIAWTISPEQEDGDALSIREPSVGDHTRTDDSMQVSDSSHAAPAEPADVATAPRPTSATKRQRVAIVPNGIGEAGTEQTAKAGASPSARTTLTVDDLDMFSDLESRKRSGSALVKSQAASDKSPKENAPKSNLTLSDLDDP
jgi:CCR4-NOT transcriptional regulation complex NOT5 subunit